MKGCATDGCSVAATDSVPTSCPRCGEAGAKVEEITLRSLLRPAALERRSEDTHRFCPTASCSVVYFGREEIFERHDLSVPVFHKESSTDRPVCYCFGVRASDIQDELGLTGRSTAGERIRKFVKAGRCACELRNPQGSCCLGNVSRLIQEIQAAAQESASRTRK